jgi:hypothetical protein
MVEMVVSLTARSWQRMCVFFFSFSRFRQIHDTQHGRFVCPPVLFALASCCHYLHLWVKYNMKRVSYTQTSFIRVSQKGILNIHCVL